MRNTQHTSSNPDQVFQAPLWRHFNISLPSQTDQPTDYLELNALSSPPVQLVHGQKSAVEPPTPNENGNGLTRSSENPPTVARLSAPGSAVSARSNCSGIQMERKGHRAANSAAVGLVRNLWVRVSESRPGGRRERDPRGVGAEGVEWVAGISTPLRINPDGSRRST